MAISLKHLFQSAKGDGPDNTEVQPSHWNAEHVITLAGQRLLGRYAAADGAAQEITLGTGLSLDPATGILSRTSDWDIAIKAANENRVAAGAVADATLKFPMLANTKYMFRLTAFFNSGPDLRVSNNGPAAPSLVRIAIRIVDNAGDSVVKMDTSYDAGNITDNASMQTVYMDGIIHNGVNAGDFSFEWGASLADGTNITLYAGSYIEYKVVP